MSTMRLSLEDIPSVTWNEPQYMGGRGRTSEADRVYHRLMEECSGAGVASVRLCCSRRGLALVDPAPRPA
jgi:hypothetical protein